MDGVLYDIGANVGTYSIYAGCKGIEVYAFEPEASNYSLLNKNIRLNDLKNVKAYCLALTNETSLSVLNLSTVESGGSLHAFSEKKDYALNDFTPVFEQGCVGMSLDDVSAFLPKPDHIKIDVDGFEHLVVNGGMNTIRNAKSVLIEINTNVREHMDIVDVMSHDFLFEESQVLKARRTSGAMRGVGNYIFHKRRSVGD